MEPLRAVTLGDVCRHAQQAEQRCGLSGALLHSHHLRVVLHNLHVDPCLLAQSGTGVESITLASPSPSRLVPPELYM
jgi:hypothetical protein